MDPVSATPIVVLVVVVFVVLLPSGVDVVVEGWEVLLMNRPIRPPIPNRNWNRHPHHYYDSCYHYCCRHYHRHHH